MNDLLQSFRRSGTQRSNVTTSSGKTERTEYQAFTTRQRANRVDIRTKLGSSHALNFQYMIDVMTDDESQVVLVLSFLIVRISGKNLGTLADALKQHVCDRLTEFDPARYAVPADPTAPLIESIDIKIRRS